MVLAPFSLASHLLKPTLLAIGGLGVDQGTNWWQQGHQVPEGLHSLTMMEDMLGWARAPPLLRCNVLVIKALIQETRLYMLTKVKLEGISPFESSCFTGDTNDQNPAGGP